MFDLSTVTKWFGDGNNLKGVGNLIGGIGGLYGALQQGRYAKKLLDLQRDSYLRGVARQDEADKNLQEAYNNSTYNKPLVRL